MTTYTRIQFPRMPPHHLNCRHSTVPQSKSPTSVIDPVGSNLPQSSHQCRCPSEWSYCMSCHSSREQSQQQNSQKSNNSLFELFAPQIITQEKLNYIVRVMNLTIENSELLASWLAENNLLDLSLIHISEPTRPY